MPPKHGDTSHVLSSGGGSKLHCTHFEGVGCPRCGAALVGLVRESSRIFLEAAPAGLDPDQIGAALAARPHVAEVHDLHIWEITSGQPALSAHVLVQPGQDCHAVRDDLAALLAAEHHIDHVTLQVDHAAAVLDITDRATAEHCEEPHGRVHRPDNSPA